MLYEVITLSKILLELKKGGLVQAVRGTGGGYRLGRDAGDIRLIEVVELIDGEATRPGCLLSGGNACSDIEPCLAHDRWAAVKEAYVGFLETTTLEDISVHTGSKGVEDGLNVRSATDE